jgi:hypothetical protein
MIDNGLNTVDDPSKLYSYQNGSAASLKGYVVPRRGFPSSTYVADLDINTRLRNKYHMNLSESVGFFGESSSKIIDTSMLGELKLEIIFTSQIASCIAGSAVPVDVPVYEQTAATFENQNNIEASTNLLNDSTDISANALSATTKLYRRGIFKNLLVGLLLELLGFLQLAILMFLLINHYPLRSKSKRRNKRCI